MGNLLRVVRKLEYAREKAAAQAASLVGRPWLEMI